MAREITIHGQVPSLKNSKQLFINRRTGKNFITSSEASKAWVNAALWQLKGQEPIENYPLGITMIFYFKGNHRKDLDNACSSVLDVLREAHIIVDDDFKHVDTITAQFGDIDKQNPRVEVWLDED